MCKCIAKGQPQPQIEWRAPNEDVYRLQSEEFEGVTVHQDGSVLIEDIRASDRGKYQCIAKVKMFDQFINKTQVFACFVILTGAAYKAGNDYFMNF